MKLIYDKSFHRDLKKINDKIILNKLKKYIEKLRLSEDLNNIKLKKISNHDKYYRIRIGDYRLGFKLLEDEIIILRFLHRKTIYKKFP